MKFKLGDYVFNTVPGSGYRGLVGKVITVVNNFANPNKTTYQVSYNGCDLNESPWYYADELQLTGPLSDIDRLRKQIEDLITERDVLKAKLGKQTQAEHELAQAEKKLARIKEIMNG